MWDLPGPGIEPVSSALAGRFLSTRPPGKPLNISFCFSGMGEQKYLVMVVTGLENGVTPKGKKKSLTSQEMTDNPRMQSYG